MKKNFLAVVGIATMLCCTACGVKAEDKQKDILNELNTKYSVSLNSADVLMLDQQGDSVSCYFGKRDDIFDTDKLYAAVYDSSTKTYIDNYSACLFESEIIDRATKASGISRTYVTVNTMEYSLTTEKYEKLNSYLDNEEQSKVLFDLYLYVSPSETFDLDTLKESLKHEFGHSGAVNVYVYDYESYFSVESKDYDAFKEIKPDKVELIEW